MIYPWQQREWEQLKKIAATHRIPHALLFTGASGVDKLSLAEHFARTLVCQTPNAFSTECGTCHSCRLFIGKAHPNVVWILPEKEGHAIKVDQIRELTDFVGHSALQGQYRVVLIHPANNMNINAANALLKTLEEPSKDTIIILISDSINQLPATILSRCQRIVFTQKNPDTEKLLEEKTAPIRDVLLGASHDPIKMAAELSDNDLLIIIDTLISVIIEKLKLNMNHTYLHFMNYLQPLRRQVCVGVNFNKQLFIENLLIRWVSSAKEENHVPG